MIDDYTQFIQYKTKYIPSLIINKKIIKNIPIVGNLLTKIFWILKYRRENPLKELYCIICSIFIKTNGITIEKRNPLLIVSLTTIPSRIDRLYLVIETLLQQSIKPDYIILWLSESDFSEDYLKSENYATRRLLKQKNRGLKIEFCKDLRSYTKILYTLKQYPEAIVVSADDDFYYPKNWLKDLYKSYIENPDYVHCHMARSIRKSTESSLLPHYQWLAHYDKFQGPSNNIFPYTGHGCLFPPGSLHPEVFNEKVFLNISPNHDDAWFKAMTLLNGLPTKRVKQVSLHLQSVRRTQSTSLGMLNIDQGQFEPQVEAIFKKYNLYQYLDDNDPD